MTAEVINKLLIWIAGFVLGYAVGVFRTSRRYRALVDNWTDRTKQGLKDRE